MNQLTDLLNQLTSQSKKILGELNKQPLSLATVEAAIEERQATIQLLSQLDPQQEREKLSEREEQIVTSLFSTFERVSSDINSGLTHALNESRETLASATKKRKADDKYRVISQPDITHF